MSRLISHERPNPEDIDAAVAAARSRIHEAGPEFGATESLLADLDQWRGCDLGAWMLVKGGWNGYWTRYCVTYHQRIAAGEPEPDNEVERFFLSSAPAVQATQQRYQHFQRILGELVPQAQIAMSLLCGAMEDLLTVPTTADAPGPVLVGADLDPESLALAWEGALARGVADRTVTIEADAWHPVEGVVRAGTAIESADLARRVDVLTSNGLNLYVPEDDRVVDLYRSFRGLLRTGGTLVTSALTSPTEWDSSGTDPQSEQRSRGLLMMTNVMWANLRPTELTVSQLRAAGLEVRDVQSDRLRAFPTFVAEAV